MKATLGGGCFWCTEAIFQRLKGVKSVEAGYAGGNQDFNKPTYEEVATGMTDHAEVIQIEFDENILSYKQLLDIFFQIHDPTTKNRQGYDVGSQYRSIILYHNVEQKQIAEEMIANLKTKGLKITTELSKLEEFHKAEDEHQDFYTNNTKLPYCKIMIAPKLKKFKNLLEKPE